MRTLGAVTLLALLLGGVVACTGGGTGGTGSPITATAVSEGSITEIGSIWVNGVEYDTTGATIVFGGSEFEDTNGEAGGTDLLPGMVVRVEGNVNPDRATGQAVRVTYRKTLLGPLASAPANGILTVLSQTVVVDPGLTRLVNIPDSDGDDKPDLGALASGDVLEISGFADDKGAIHATYIERKPGETEFELRGTVTYIDPASAYRFTVGALMVDATNIRLETHAGQRVEVKGILDGEGVLVASSLEIEDGRIHSEDIDEAQLEGLVTSMGPSYSAFVLNGQPVNALNAEFNGGDPTAIAPGVRLEVEGAIRDGVLVAQEVSFADAIELTAPVLAVGPDSLTLDGLLTTGGERIQVVVRDGVTEFEGDGIAGLADITIGNLVELRARESGGVLLATKISGQGPVETEAAIVLQGPVDLAQITGQVITLLGVDIDTGDPGLLILDDAGQPLSSQELIAALGNNPGAVIEVEGTWAGGTAPIMWETLELDD